MFLVGLTGGIGTGKSSASTIFRELGVPVVDADLIARQVVEPGRPAWQKIKVSNTCACRKVTCLQKIPISDVFEPPVFFAIHP